MGGVADDAVARRYYDASRVTDSFIIEGVVPGDALVLAADVKKIAASERLPAPKINYDSESRVMELRGRLN